MKIEKIIKNNDFRKNPKNQDMIIKKIYEILKFIFISILGISIMSDEEKYTKIRYSFGELSKEMSIVTKCFYIWKTIVESRDISTSGLEQAEKNVKMMKHYGDLFTLIEFSCIFVPIMGITKCFDTSKRKDNINIKKLIREIDNSKSIFTPKIFINILSKAYPKELSVYNAERDVLDITSIEKEFRNLYKTHSPTIKRLRIIRNKQLAHLDDTVINKDFKPTEAENLIDAIQKLINNVAKQIIAPSHMWDMEKGIAINEVKFLFKNLTTS